MPGGLSVTQILSDETHYRPFVCACCENLVALESAVVTSRCSHAFCRECLETWIMNSSDNINQCPGCNHALHEDPSLECMELGPDSIVVAARPLAEAQPLAFQLLQLVQVGCLATDKSNRCDWNGNYGDYPRHIQCHAALGTDPQAVAVSSSSSSSAVVVAPIDKEERPQTPTPADADAAAAEEEEEANPISMDQLKTPKSPRWMASNGSIAQAPTLNGKASAPGAAPSSVPLVARDTPPNLVKRTKSLNPNPAANAGSVAAVQRNMGKAVPEDKVLKKRSSSRKLSLNDSINDLDTSQANNVNELQNQSSINSLQGWNNSFSEEQNRPLETLVENGNDSSSVLLDAEKIQQTLDQAEKLKKQANAKFNKGDFNAARTLYTNGINLMASIPRRENDADGELLSNMHSNRAVTYFREKQFDRCIEDCNMAIQYDRTYEKSWIRKWRALMALGVFEEALACLEHGCETVSNPNKIKKELTKAREEMDMYQESRRLLEEREFAAVRDMLKTYIRNSDNIGLLHMAALADCGLGNAEAALEKANKALRFNPVQPDGLAIRGYGLFLSGDTEKGTSLIQDAHSRDKENKRIKKDFQRCSKTHSALTKGRSCVKRGRYMDAVEHFTSALKECGVISETTILYGMLRSERAEAWMLCDKFLEALKDCQEVINAQRENAAAWTVRAEVLIALGKAEEAKKELTLIRKTWGADNQTVEEGYRRVDFELRVMKADRDLMRFIKELDRGYVPEGGVVPEDENGRNSSARRGGGSGSGERSNGPSIDRRAMMERMASRRGMGTKQASSRRLLQETEKPKSSRNLMVMETAVDKQMSSRNLMDGTRQQSSRNLMQGNRPQSSSRQSSSRNLTTSGHRAQSSRRLVDGDRPSSNKRVGGDAEADKRSAMRKAKSSRRVGDGENGSSYNSSSKQKRDGMDKKSLSERNFQSTKPRPASVKRA